MSESHLVASRRAYTGKVISLDIDTVRYPDGSLGELEMVRHPGATAVVPLLSAAAGTDAELVLLRQYRYASEQILYEIPAGRLKPGESAEACARRELKEETGFTAAHMEPLLSFYTTPGFTDERITAFLATGLTRGAPDHEADEFIEVVTCTLSKALSMIRGGEISDAKTALALLFVAAFHFRKDRTVGP